MITFTESPTWGKDTFLEVYYSYCVAVRTKPPDKKGNYTIIILCYASEISIIVFVEKVIRIVFEPTRFRLNCLSKFILFFS